MGKLNFYHLLASLDLREKYAVMDTLNRELRQVDLQQFIRKTGSKITVLPPNTEENNYGDLFINKFFLFN